MHDVNHAHKPLHRSTMSRRHYLFTLLFDRRAINLPVYSASYSTICLRYVLRPTKFALGWGFVERLVDGLSVYNDIHKTESFHFGIMNRLLSRVAIL